MPVTGCSAEHSAARALRDDLADGESGDGGGDERQMRGVSIGGEQPEALRPAELRDVQFIRQT